MVSSDAADSRIGDIGGVVGLDADVDVAAAVAVVELVCI